MKRQRLIDLYPFFLLLLCILLVLSSLGMLPLYGSDDVFYTTDAWVDLQLKSLYSTNYFDMAMNRGYLGSFYSLFFVLLGRSATLYYFFAVSLYGLSVVSCYLSIKAILKSHRACTWIALICSLFFLTYVPMFQIVSRIQGCAYHIVMIMFWGIMYLLFRKKLESVKDILLSALLFWLSLHFYEILIVLVPLVPLLYFVIRWESKSKIQLKTLLATFSFGVLALIHLLILNSRKGAPIWERGASAGGDSIFVKVWKMFKMSFYGSVEKDYFKLVWERFYGFFDVYLKYSLTPLVAIIVVASSLFLINRMLSLKSKKQLFSLGKIPIFIFLFFAIVSPMVSISLTTTFIFSRFFYLSGAFLSLAFAFLMANYMSKWMPLVLSGLILLQTPAFMEQMNHHARAAEMDQLLRPGMHHALKDLKSDNYVLVVYPYDTSIAYHHPKQSIGAELVVFPYLSEIWSMLPTLDGDVPYFSIKRKPKVLEEKLQEYFENLKNSSKLRFLWFDDRYRVFYVAEASMSFNGITSNYKFFIPEDVEEPNISHHQELIGGDSLDLKLISVDSIK